MQTRLGGAFSQPIKTIFIGESVGSGTPGSILFVDSSNSLAQNNANLFWDNTNNSFHINSQTNYLSTNTTLQLYAPSTAGSALDINCANGNPWVTRWNRVDAGLLYKLFVNASGTFEFFDTNNILAIAMAQGGGVGIGTASLANGNGLTIEPSARTSGTPSVETIISPADTGLTISEFHDINWNLSSTRTFTTGGGTVTNQRSVYIQPPTYAASTNAVTLTNASTVYIVGAPIAGSNVTITNPASLIVASGNVGIGTSAPTELVHLSKTTGNFTTLRFDSGTTQGYFFSYDGDNSVNIGSNSSSQVNLRMNNSTVFSINTSKNMIAVGLMATYDNISTAGFGIPAIFGLDSRTGLTASDSSATTLYTTTAAGQLYRISVDLFLTAVSAGSGTYTITWTENSTSKTLSVTATVINTEETATDIIRPDNGTDITGQLTVSGFTGSADVVGIVERLA